MGSSPSHVSASTRYTNSSWYDGKNNEEGELKIYSLRIGSVLGHGARHFLVMDGCHPDKRVCFEWTAINGEGIFSHYATKRIYGQQCLSLGRYKLSEVYKACCEATHDNLKYSSNNNCNHWTNRACLYLGWIVDCQWHCRYIL
ncbi:unnamed protein product [Rotaria magnacalcarata]|uniref:Uncharacterized protein n=1 Tax=Rotaria magnacalcarata TaxID=392030 RepID=A0A816QG23_9BILA|nr:unnamed protein product [Rotaria magnacalcarata]CAF2059978.1 unnamed protein product [Rotaria magnacalcarata]CAF3942291.1 unnamed protein product [Rotaria magnacalcarata]CAF4103587.1 unnamed protein product [Rotaria magnacalcarata]